MLLSMSCCTAHAQYSFWGPWRSGQQATGEISGINYANANPPVVGLGGNGMMLGSVSGTGITTANDDVIFASVANSVFKVARTTDPAPGLTNVAFGDLNGKWPIYNGTQIAFYSPLTGTGTTTADNEAFWYGNPASLQLLARKGDPVTGLTNVNYNHGIQTFRMNAGGTVAFFTNLTGAGTTGSTNQGIAVGTPANLGLTIRKGDSAPGLTGVTYSGFDTNTLTFNNNGDLGFQTSLTGTGVTGTNNNALWIKPQGSAAQLLARRGDTPPNAAGTTFDNLTSGNYVINNNKFAAFRADLTGGSVTGSNNTGIWAGTVGNLQYVAREGDATSLSGITYSTTLNSPIVTSNNKVIFYSTLTGTGVTSNNDQSIWYGDPGNLQLLARSGDPAGNTGLFFHVFYQNFHAMADGSVVFAAQIGTTPTGNNLTDSLWIGTPAGLTMIVRQNNMVPLGPDFGSYQVGSIRLLQAFDSGGEDGFARSVADDNTIGVEIGFNGFQTGVIITAVPELSTIISITTTLTAATLSIIWLRKRQSQLLKTELKVEE